MDKHILLVAYTFPPSPGIGGRRWAKFAKYFTKLGYTVHVICSEQQNNELSLWYNDIKDNSKIVLYKIIQAYPSILRKVPENNFERIKYKLANSYIKLVSKGTPYDRSLFWNEDFESQASKIIEEFKVDFVFVTIAPLHYAFRLINLKKKFSTTKFIADFRDPWSRGNGYGFPQKNAKRQEVEFEKEKLVCNNYDLITFAHGNTLIDSQAAFNIKKENCYLLEHAIDTDDYVAKVVPKDQDKIKVIYMGTFYQGLKKHFDSIFKSTIDNSKLFFEFYTSNQIPSYVEFANPSQVSFNKQIEPKMLFSKIAQANYVLIIYSENMKTLMYTKIKEIVYTRTPIIIISKKGDASDFIVSNRLGIHLDYHEIETKLPNIFSEVMMDNYNYTFDTSSFTFENVTEKLIRKINSL